ncbi:4-hydroxyphenylacetate 3-monooxygenase, oxygenase component [Sutcliffiella rhizosphaerae]|uniref:4-hydroxyphenylacetate 3-monooxygenase oxygenase component n=1 Tax=Sutcliffiella rhizosphaerae TaxID=2880967 RepID=A0ABM8YJU1_9BACI|nr:4-hydroxyphenylacetate 3-monooxygenase, oxygenase component [Sutcliffiella rhizosphaerae]CAG9620204.1 4-hydroxyphenylacetate 3-monooxygenase oxygenase component [Sutcliffiella rhizosphaerae]
MAIISGKQYIERIDALKSNVWHNGQQVTGKISEHPAFSGVMKSQAALYDMQHDQKYKEIMTFTSDTTGELVGTSYLRPKTKEDLEKRRKMIQLWAKSTFGMMGRSPDYKNSTIMALASSAHLLDEQGEEFSDRLRNFYEYARHHDLSFTHTFITPQVNRSAMHFEDDDNIVAARIVAKTSEGLIIKGARLLATQGGITDEIIISSSGLKMFEEPFAYAFSIPSNTKGLKFICRESFSYDSSSFNHPLGSRFEEMDAIVVLDNVLVPWERVFVFENVAVANKLYSISNFKPLVCHQVVSRQVVKAEFILGVAQMIVNTIAIGEYGHVKEKISEIIIALENHKALLLASEMNAKLDQFGTMVPDLTPLTVATVQFPKVYPRFMEILQLLGASGLVSIPTEADMAAPIRGDIDQYLQSATSDAESRVKLYRLAWDISMSAFGTRQTLYERFFFGCPTRLAMGLYQEYDRLHLVEDVAKKFEIK